GSPAVGARHGAGARRGRAAAHGLRDHRRQLRRMARAPARGERAAARPNELARGRAQHLLRGPGRAHARTGYAL
ncbi:MAG: hypothetical protein AVDCRST_MAG39-1354, partial [uncultured Sphingomonadaceae bacterium]